MCSITTDQVFVFSEAVLSASDRIFLMTETVLSVVEGIVFLTDASFLAPRTTVSVAEKIVGAAPARCVSTNHHSFEDTHGLFGAIIGKADYDAILRLGYPCPACLNG